MRATKWCSPKFQGCDSSDGEYLAHIGRAERMVGCMTAAKKNMVYIMEKPKPRSEQQVKADAKRVADAVSRAAKFLKNVRGKEFLLL